MYDVVSSEETKIGRFKIIMEQIRKDGKLAPYSYIKIRPGIVIIPIMPNGNLLLLKEYRHAIDSWEYEFPCGMIDVEESPEDAAKRELLEETGCKVVDLISLGSFYPSFGSTDEIIYLFAGNISISDDFDITNDGDIYGREILEEICMEEKSVEEVEQMIQNDQFRMGAGLVAWLKWRMIKL